MNRPVLFIGTAIAAALIAAGFRADGTGAIINSSRGLTACFEPDDPQWEAAIERATKTTVQDLLQGTPMRALSTC